MHKGESYKYITERYVQQRMNVQGQEGRMYKGERVANVGEGQVYEGERDKCTRGRGTSVREEEGQMY